MLRKYKVAAYFNGHDHALAVAVDPEDASKYETKYITTGAGKLALTLFHAPKPQDLLDLQPIPSAGFKFCSLLPRHFTQTSIQTLDQSRAADPRCRVMCKIVHSAPCPPSSPTKPATTTCTILFCDALLAFTCIAFI